MSTDRFGNAFAPGLPYARGEIISSTADDIRKLEQAWRIIDQRIRKYGRDSVFILTGLEHSLPLQAEDLPIADDEIAPALCFGRLKTLALEHLGGSAQSHDIAVFNRVTGATIATHLTVVKPGELVVAVSASRSHPSVIRAAALAGARFVDTKGADEFASVLEREPKVALVVLTRVAVTYELLGIEAIRRVVKLARQRNAVIYVDDAGGARVGPAIFDQPRTLELGVDVGATGLDKYGTVGPRLGLMAGEKELVARIRAKAFECALEARQMLYPAVVRTLEQYSPEKVRTLVETTKSVSAALREIFGDLVVETPGCLLTKLQGEDVLQIAMDRGGIRQAPIVPYEASAALCMLLLRDYGALGVHFIGLPPGAGNVVFKFVPPETLARLGGPQALAKAVDSSLNSLAHLLKDPAQVRALIFGEQDE